jgi:SM-20-related protein
MIIDDSLFPRIANALADEGYIVLADFLPNQISQQLYDHVTQLPDDSFKQASVGRQQDHQLNQQIRNDKTQWLSEQHPVEQIYLDVMEQCRVELNQRLFLGLRNVEAHFAHYEAGSFYQRHVDAFQGQSNRVVSSVFYLNPDWSDEDGGELLLYQPDSDEVLCTVNPQFGSMVLFLSEQFPHEVLPATCDRYSIAGWFRTDNPF